MTNKNHVFNDFYQNISEWIEDAKAHEITKIVEVVEQAKSYLAAAEHIPEKKVKQFIDSFVYDLHEFYQRNQTQAQDSLYLALLNESLWQSLATLTDKSQVEWSELMDDFEHDGLYHVDDYIGFGELECKNCHERLSVTHLSKVTSCIHCGGEQFIRHGMKP